MAFKDILLALTSYPDPTPGGAVDQAVAFAGLLDARISAVAFEVEVQVPGRHFLADMLANIPSLIAAERDKSSKNAHDLLSAFERTATRRGVFQEKILERCKTYQVAELLTGYARTRDLTIVPLREGDGTEHWSAESIIFGSGRPTVILPQASEHGRTLALDTVVIAWDFSRPAARAVADALPILEKAKLVHVVTVTKEKAIDTSRSGTELTKHLAHHGVKIVLDTVDAEGRPIGNVLDAYIASRNADLLVMGAYGHSRVRDFVLGGATKSMVARPPVPVFLSQ
jgi:nucleotide-binding universal stress UspA family protein